MNSMLNEESCFLSTFIFIGTGTVKLLLYTYEVSKRDSDRTKALYGLRFPRARSYPRRLQQLQPQV